MLDAYRNSIGPAARRRRATDRASKQKNTSSLDPAKSTQVDARTRNVGNADCPHHQSTKTLNEVILLAVARVGISLIPAIAFRVFVSGLNLRDEFPSPGQNSVRHPTPNKNPVAFRVPS